MNVLACRVVFLIPVIPLGSAELLKFVIGEGSLTPSALKGGIR